MKIEVVVVDDINEKEELKALKKLVRKLESSTGLLFFF